ncbi:hypothetical protein QFC19_005820 [Naganishia cerealis]|uniref:Uncharacterized protein n=1 Tax=Naganishia cerealis TaxID=610337 RepID=A0ACC2VM62_9TREE|nr:hypothetical protein QFC19_005820 [Naganishia cerealis]
MGSSKPPSLSNDKSQWKFPSNENTTGSADEQSDLDQTSRRTKYGWQSPRYAVEDGHKGEKLLSNGGQSRHRKTTSHTRKVSISNGFAGLGYGRRVDAVALADLDGSSATEDDSDGVKIKIKNKVEVMDRRAEVSGGLTGKDKHAFILLIVLCKISHTLSLLKLGNSIEVLTVHLLNHSHARPVRGDSSGISEKPAQTN